jgi:UDP-N-acetylmuramate dehydrogenase
VTTPTPLAHGDVERVERILARKVSGRVRVAQSLAPFTTFRVGGPAALFVEPEDEGDLSALSEAIGESGVPFMVLGKGSNVLIADAGFPGIVVRLGKAFRWSREEGDGLSAGAAMPLPALAGIASSAGLSGLEFGVAIPGSLGGAVRMNAGAHHRSMSDVLERVELFSIGSGERSTRLAPELSFRYRGSALPSDAIVLSAAVALEPRSAEAIREEMDEAREWRRRTQPLAEPNCGSVFKNPEGESAARLIEAADGKGLSVGGARVAEKHANFIVTSEGARAADVLELIGKVQGIVAARFGIRLETEVHLVGHFDPAPA